jgi:hypothetical protein
MCEKNEESVDYLLLQCEVTCALWNAFGYLESCLDELLTCLFVSGLLVALEVSLGGR